MTQDPYGQPPGSGYVVRGGVVPGDEADATPPTTPMTRFQKVASAFRGDRNDPAVTERASSDQGAEPADQQSPDPYRTWPGADPAGPGAQDVRDEADQDATRPEDVTPARSPQEGTRDFWEDASETGSEEATAGESPDGPAAGAAEPAMVGRHAGAPAQEGGLRPGESDSAPGDFSNLLPDAAEFKARWQQVQFAFVDDPRGSVTEAADVIAQVTAKLEAAIQERQRAIAARQRALRDRWSEGSADTESLRETLLMYRALLNQLTGPAAG